MTIAWGPAAVPLGAWSGVICFSQAQVFSAAAATAVYQVCRSQFVSLGCMGSGAGVQGKAGHLAAAVPHSLLPRRTL